MKKMNKNNNNNIETESQTDSANTSKNSAVIARTLEQKEDETQVVTHSSVALTKLGGLITSLMNFVKAKNNVHHSIKEQVRSMVVTYNEALDEMQTNAKKRKQVDQAVQTLSITTAKRGRDQQDDTPTAKKMKHQPSSSGIKAKSLPSSQQVEDTVSPSEWKTVKRVKKVKRKEKVQRKDIEQKKTRPTAMIISANGVNTYADILRKIKADPNLNDFGKNVKKIRRTQKGELLLEIDTTNKEETGSFNELVGKTLMGTAEIRTKVSETLIECKDLDEVTTAVDICAAIAEQLNVRDIDESSVKSIRKAYGGTQTAKVSLPDTLAQKALILGKLRIGWSICRVRKPIMIKRCFRCLEFGHMANVCKNIDRSNLCTKCGEPNHVARVCKSNARCLFCVANKETDTGHIAGSSKCPVFKKVLSQRTK